MFEETLDKKKNEKKEKIYQYNVRFNVNKNRTNRVIKSSIVIESIPRQNLVLPCLVRGWSFFFWSREIYEKFAVNILSDNSMARHDQAKQQRSRFETLLEGRNSVSFEFSSWPGAATHAA